MESRRCSIMSSVMLIMSLPTGMPLAITGKDSGALDGLSGISEKLSENSLERNENAYALELDGPNADEVGPFDEGDIVHPGLFERHVRAVASEEYKKWAYGVVPYYIEPYFNGEQKKIIYAAMDEIRAKTCINFVERTTEPDYIRITPGEGCSSYVGRRGGQQAVTLDPWRCLGEVGVVAHELLHVLGFYHEHTRLDRDNYIDVLWNNMESGREVNFQKRAVGTIDSLGKPYDYNSVMHYSAYAFSRDERRPTLVPRQSAINLQSLGQRRELSDLDVQKINAYYCDGKYNPNAPPKNEVRIRNYVRPAEPLIEQTTMKPRPTTVAVTAASLRNVALKKLARANVGTNPCEANFQADAVTTAKDGTMHLFSGSQFWVIDPHRYISRPLLIRDYYSGLPDNLDAAFTWTNGHTYFFKDNLYWKYTDYNPMEGYPQDVRSGFPGLPDSLDGALIWSDSRIIFIKDASYWILHPTYLSQVRGPFALPGDFPVNVEAGLELAPEGSSQSDLFVIAEGVVYPVDKTNFKIASHHRRQHLRDWLRCDLYVESNAGADGSDASWR